MTPGETRSIKVWVDGTRVLDPASAGITFTSSDTSVARVSTGGIITAVSAGGAIITVAQGTNTETVSVTIQ